MIVKKIIEKFMDRKITLSTAESCTGGGFSEKITSYPGVSSFFLGGVVTYSNESKIDLLGVGRKTIEVKGAVSNETCTEMLKGLKKLFNSDAGVAITGIAGPGGGSQEKPVGTVYIGIFYKNKIVVVRELFLNNSRAFIQDEAKRRAFELLNEVIESV